MAKKDEPKGLQKLLEDGLADLYYAEKKIAAALPKMAKAAQDEDLKACFLSHLDETKGQIEKLEQAFAALGKPAKGKKCPAIDGILEEGTEIMEEFKGDSALDAGLVAAAQKVEHYEITSYGSACAWAEQLGHDEVKELIDSILEEEKAADEKLTEIGETVNAAASEGSDEEEEENDRGKGNRKLAVASKKPAAKKSAPAKKGTRR